MKFIKQFIFILFFTSITLFAQSSEKTVNKIDDLINRYNQLRLFNGSVLVAVDGEVLLKKGYGPANIELNVDNKPETKFRLGSITKQFTSALILILEQQGKLSVEDKISDHLDYFRKDLGQKISIHHLMTHTSGLPEYLRTPDFMRTTAKLHADVKQFIIDYCSDDLNFEPGTDWSYSNSGYFILGAIIEKVSGMTYEEALNNFIFKPLEMNDSGYDLLTPIITNRAAGYVKQFIGYTNADFIDMTVPYSAGSLYSTVEDLYKWDRSLYTNKILSDKSREKMFTGYADAMGAKYGYGWVIAETVEDGDTITYTSHGGGINGFNTLITRRLYDQSLVVLLNNTRLAPLNEMETKIFEIIDGKEYTFPKQPIEDYLYSVISDEGIKIALSNFDALNESGDIESFIVSEVGLNNLGYALMAEDKLDAAIDIFALNIKLYPESFNTYDSMGEALLEKGEKEKAIENYKKSVELNPRNQNGIDVLKKLGVEVEEPAEVELTLEQLEEFVGKYQLAPNFYIEVFIKDGKLFERATGQEAFEIYPESESKFYMKVVDAQIEFKRDENGKVNEMILYQGGREVPGKKVE